MSGSGVVGAGGMWVMCWCVGVGCGVECQSYQFRSYRFQSYHFQSYCFHSYRFGLGFKVVAGLNGAGADGGSRSLFHH